jgi:hypothetical protein
MAVVIPGPPLGIEATDFSATAVLQLLYTETTAFEWLFPREKATLRDTGKGT